MSPRLKAFSDFYSSLDSEKLSHLSEVYTSNIRFIDPVHEIVGVQHLSQYFEKLCANLLCCRFVFLSYSEADSSVWLVWTMHYAHPKIAGGKELSLQGATELRFEQDRVCYHRDFYDMGAMLYEHLPVMGRVIRYVKEALQ